MALYARLWTDILDDPKLMRAAGEGAKHLILLPWIIAFAKRADAEGRIEIAGFPAKPREIARSIPNATPRSVAKALAELRAMDVVSTDPDGAYRFTAWDYRNSGKTSDSREAIAERVRKHRERKKRADVTPVTPRNALPNVTDVTDVTSKRVESREEREESREYRHKASSTQKVSTAPPAPRRTRAALPPAARDFGRIFYRDTGATIERQEQVRRQLLATLNGGAQIRKGVRVLAGSSARLEAKCREVIAEGMKDPDKAIVVLLKKLADVGNAQDSPTERAATEEKRDEQHSAVRLARAEAWLGTNPEFATTIDRDVETRFAEEQAKLAQPIAKSYADLTLRFYRNAAVLKAWTDAGEPIVQPAAAGGQSP